MPNVMAPALSNPACVEAGRKALAIVEAASVRIERGSRENDTGARLADWQRAIDAAQAELLTCRAAVTTTSAATASAAARPADAMAGMDHSKMATAGAPTKAGGGPAPAPGAAKLPMNMAERLADPSCPDNVGQATAPKAVYERKVYYFCSTKTRDRFRKDPAAYLKKHPR